MSLLGGEESLSIIVKLQDEASKELRELQGKFTDFGSSMESSISASRSFAVGLLGIGTAVGALGYKMIDAAAGIETQRIAFKTLLGSMEAADEAIKMIQKDAASTPFEFAGLLKANQALTLVTKNAGKSEAVLLNVGKALAAAGKGQAELDNIILNLQQIGNTGKISEMDIRQFGFSGINILELLASYYGTTKEAAGEMVKQSKDAFADLSAAFAKAGTDGGQFANAFTNQTGSLNQLISNLKDQWNIFLAGEGAIFIEWAKKVVLLLTDIVQNVLPAVIQRLQDLSKWFADNQVAIGAVAGAIVGALVPATYAIIAAFALWAIEMAPFLIGGALIGGAIAGILLVVKNWDYVAMQFKATGELIAFTWKSMWWNFQNAVNDIWQGIKTSISDSINWIMEKINVLINAMNAVTSGAAGLFGGTGSAVRIPTIPKLAEGGIVSSPTIAMIGEAGPEAVVPLSKMGSVGGGGATIVINYPSFKDQNDEDRMRAMLDQYFRPLLMNNKI